MRLTLSTLVVVGSALAAACGGPAVEADRPVAVTYRPDVLLPRDTTVVRGVVPRHSTLDTMLREHGLAGEVVHSVISAARTTFDPRRLKSLQPFLLELTADGALSMFEYEIDADSFLRVAPAGDKEGALQAEVLPIPKTLQHDAVSGGIDADTPSLFASIEATGERPELAIEMARLFAGEIDFNNDLQPGDRYAVAFERFAREGRPVSYGEITAAEFENDGRIVHAIRFTAPGGKADYYDAQGRSLRRFFLKSPLKFEPRITSRFSNRRMHPVLHTARAHRGVDYAAPHGAEVVAIAAGTVVSVTSDRTNGRMVRLRHTSGYESYYLHLSAFARGLRAGAHVTQGQVVGRVGATGLATGPHLHYGLRKNGVFVDPRREHARQPPGEPIPPTHLPGYRLVRDGVLRQLSTTLVAEAPRKQADAVKAGDSK